MFKKLFGKKAAKPNDAYDEAAENEWYHQKSRFMEDVLGLEHDMVLHAIIPFAVGGALDRYYYPNGVPGTGIATKELVDRHGNGPSNRVYPCYELVMFTRHAHNQENTHNEDTSYGKAHQNIARITNPLARYANEATLNSGDTIEFPVDFDDVGGKCLILDDYTAGRGPGPKGMGLMLVMEVFRSEMEYSRKYGSPKFIQMLKDAGHYPYSDLERDPLI